MNGVIRERKKNIACNRIVRKCTDMQTVNLCYRLDSLSSGRYESGIISILRVSFLERPYKVENIHEYTVGRCTDLWTHLSQEINATETFYCYEA